MKIDVIDQKGKPAGQITVSDDVFKAERNVYLIHEVATVQANNRRQGSKANLTRTEVRGHAKKPYRQKGTGNARQGSTKAPHHRGGGVAWAAEPRDFSSKINKKQRMAAFVSAISAKLADKELIVINDTKIKAPKTKEVVKIIKALKMEDKTIMFVIASANTDFVRGANNIPAIEVIPAAQLSVYDIVNNKFLIASVDAIKNIEEAYGNETQRKVVSPAPIKPAAVKPKSDAVKSTVPVKAETKKVAK